MRYPHNIVVEVLAETGLVGFALWSAAIVALFLALRGDRLFRFAFVVCLSYAMTSGDLGGNYEYWLFGLIGTVVAQSVSGVEAFEEAEAGAEAQPSEFHGHET